MSKTTCWRSTRSRLDGPDQQDHRRGPRGGPGVAGPAAGAGVAGDLPQRHGVQCRRRRRGQEEAAHLAVGVDVDSRKEVLGIWVEHTAGAKFWLRVMNDLKSRGIA